MAAATYNFEIEQGSTLLKPIVWKDSTGTPVNLNNFTAKMQVRKSAQSIDVLLELSTENGGISINPNAGAITLIFSATTTALIDWSRGKYDLQVFSIDGTVVRLIEGEITISKEITR